MCREEGVLVSNRPGVYGGSWAAKVYWKPEALWVWVGMGESPQKEPLRWGHLPRADLSEG